MSLLFLRTFHSVGVIFGAFGLHFHPFKARTLAGLLSAWSLTVTSIIFFTPSIRMVGFWDHIALHPPIDLCLYDLNSGWPGPDSLSVSVQVAGHRWEFPKNLGEEPALFILEGIQMKLVCGGNTSARFNGNSRRNLMRRSSYLVFVLMIRRLWVKCNQILGNATSFLIHRHYWGYSRCKNWHVISLSRIQSSIFTYAFFSSIALGNLKFFLNRKYPSKIGEFWMSITFYPVQSEVKFNMWSRWTKRYFDSYHNKIKASILHIFKHQLSCREFANTTSETAILSPPFSLPIPEIDSCACL